MQAAAAGRGAVWIPLILAGLLAGHFISGTANQPALDYYAFPWKSSWISSPHPDGSTACFRKEVLVTGRIRSAWLAVAADNFYQLQVNGRRLKPFFHPGRFRTWLNTQTVYSALGHPRNRDEGLLFEISDLLKPGRNAITVFVQADSGRARLAVQGAIDDGESREILTDTSWRCSPVRTIANGVEWTSPQFPAHRWAPAVDTGERPDATVDGPIAPLETPRSGFYISSSGDRSATVRFRREVALGGKVDSGWLRITTTGDYDLFLNDRLIGSNSIADRQSERVLSIRDHVDAFERVQLEEEEEDFPEVRPSVWTDTYALKDVPVSDPLRLEVVVHPHEVEEARRLPLIHLDGRLESDGRTVIISTDATWEAKTELEGDRSVGAQTDLEGDRFVGAQTDLEGDRSVGANDWQNARAAAGVRIADPPGLRSRFADEVRRRPGSRLIGTVVSGTVFAVALVGIALFGRRCGHTLNAGAIALPAAIVLVAAWVLQGVFDPSPQDRFFTSPAFGWATVVLALAASAGLAFFAPRAAVSAVRRPVSLAWLDRYGYAAVVAAIMVAAFAVYTYRLGADGLLADEYVSILAAQGITRSGVPLYEHTGILYTRSALFHYLLAGMISIGGPLEPMSTRFLAGIWQLATIPLVYLFVRELKGRSAGLFGAAVVAFSPYLVFYAREIRFYTQFSFFVTLAFYLLLRSLRNPDRFWYRPGTLLAYCGAFLSQQFALTILPAMLLATAFQGQLRLWFRPKNLPWVALAIGVMAADRIVYARYCQTPLPYVDAEAVVLLSLHTDILEMIPSMLLSHVERSQAPLGLLYLGGLLFGWVRLFRRPTEDGGRTTVDGRRTTDDGKPEEGKTGLSTGRSESLLRNAEMGTGSPVTRHPSPVTISPSVALSWWTYLYLVTAPTILLTSLLAPRPSSRYVVHMAPLVAIVAVCVAFDLARILRDFACRLSGPATGRYVRTLAHCAILITVFAAFRPVRMAHALDRRINQDNTTAARFVADHRRPGDVWMFRSPEIAMIELGRCHYEWRNKRGSIFRFIEKNGQMRERNSGAVAVDNIDKLRQLCAEHPRIWLVLPAGAMRISGSEFGDRMRDFVQKNFTLVKEPLGMEVHLWDRSSGRYRNTAPDHGFSQFNFDH